MASIIRRGQYVFRKTSRPPSWRNVNTNEIIRAPRNASLSELQKLSSSGRKTFVEVPGRNFYGDDRQAASINVRKAKREAQEIAKRRRARQRK